MHAHQKTNESNLQEILINFRSDKQEQMEHWFRLLTRILDSRKTKTKENRREKQNFRLERPNREIIVLCNTYAGLRDSRSIYNTKLKSLLDRANFQVNYAGSTRDESFSSFYVDVFDLFFRNSQSLSR